MEKKERIRKSYSELPEGQEASPAAKESQKKENREIRILKKGKTLNKKNDPGRFSGDGINFRAKIIGIEDVFDARGNRMCQGALQKLKAAAKTSGDHKQRIILNISLNGIIIKDEKSREVLHHHPIHKISCISQDTKDSRTFGFVYGCPQTGHRFFAIKTEKTASQVVVTLRDLFLVALELKEKEIEKNIDTQEEINDCEEDIVFPNGNSTECDLSTTALGNDVENSKMKSHLLYSNTVLLPEEVVPPPPPQKNRSTSSEPAVETLQSELNILKQGISQMDQSIALVVSQSNLGVSFSEDDVSETSTNSVPSSFQFKLDKLSSLYHETMSISSRSSSISDYNIYVNDKENDTARKETAGNLGSATSDGCPSGVNLGSAVSDACPSSVNLGSAASDGCPSSVNLGPAASDGCPSGMNLGSAASDGCSSGMNIGSEGCSSGVSSSLSVGGNSSVCEPVEDRYAVFLEIDSLPSIFDDPSIVLVPDEKAECAPSEINKISRENESEEYELKFSTPPVPFAELDPLGNQPYVDKRDFFQEIKNPPKKVLKDLIGVNIFCGSLASDAFSNSPECLSVCNFKCKRSSEGSLDCEGIQKPPLVIPPRLPPKKTAPPLVTSESFTENVFLESWESTNPFNPFLTENYPDAPPPPPPRIPTKISDCFPPRPPSRVNCTPTPPLPRRKVPLGSTYQRTWFSFDQDFVSSPPPSPSLAPPSEPVAPPLPSPARKLPPLKPESPLLVKSSSASNSPSNVRRLHSKNSLLDAVNVLKESDSKTFSVVENGASKEEVKDSKTSVKEAQNPSIGTFSSASDSPLTVRRLHEKNFALESTIAQREIEDNILARVESGASNKGRDSGINHIVESQCYSSRIQEEGDTLSDPVDCSSPLSESQKPLEEILCPPLPPKPASQLAQCSISSFSSSVTESSHSSTSLVFSSLDSRKSDSSSEALLSMDSQSDIMVQKTSHSQSSSGGGAEQSPDSIFRRKSDPFADDFFLTLPKKSNAQSVTKNSTTTTVVEMPFDHIKAPT